MTYAPLYTSIEAIQSTLQIKITSETHPDTTDVLSWIEEVEQDIKDKRLGSYATSGYITFDFPQTNKTWKDTVALKYADIPINIIGKVVPLPYTPIVSITSMAYNTAELNATASWTTMTEGPGTDSDFVILKDSDNTGYALFVYGDATSYTGRQRLRASYTYGHDTSVITLREYATLRVAKKVLFARAMSGQPIGIATYRGPDLQEFVNTQLSDVDSKIDARIKELEDQIMASSKIAVGFV